jgi:hypothetical protein
MGKFLGLSLGGVAVAVVGGVIALAVFRPQICNSTTPLNRLCGISQRLASIGSGGKPLTGNAGTTGQQNVAAHLQARRNANPNKKSVVGNTVSRFAGHADRPSWAIA